MFAELKTLKVDNYALANQQIEIIEAINKLINDKLTVMRKFYTCNLSYSSEPSLKNKTTIANNYKIDFLDFDTKEVLGYLKIIVENIEENKNVE